jgi:hypothetical protein
MSKVDKENDNQYSKEKDTGIVEEKGIKMDVVVSYWGNNYCSNFKAQVTDTLYNSFRKMLRDGANLSLRMYS